MARILQAIETLDCGGAEVVVINLIERLRFHHEVILCCVKKTGPLLKRIPKGIRILCLHKPEGNDLRTFIKMGVIIKRFKIDLVHTHNWDVLWDAALGSMLVGKIPVVHTIHGLFWRHAPTFIGRKKNFFRRRLERISAWYASRLISVSNYLRKQVIDELAISGRKILTIRNGIPVTSSNLYEKRMRSKGNQEVRLITVGRLSRVKNYPMLLKAFSIALKKSKIPLRLIFVGDGPERGHLIELSNKLGIMDYVNFLGFRENVEELLWQSDIFVLSSHYEGISIAILEAMRAGLPVIATSVGGNVETVKHGVSGLLCKKDDHIDFATQIVFLSENREVRLRIGREAYSRLTSFFNIDKTVKAYLNVYEQAMRNNIKMSG